MSTKSNYESLSTQASLNNNEIKSNISEADSKSSLAIADEEAMCGLIHNDCYRSIINKFFDFYNFNESQEEDQEANPLFIDKDVIIESFKSDIIQYLNHNSQKGFEQEDDSKYKFKYYQGMNDLIIFFILLEKTSQMHLERFSYSEVNQNNKNNKLEIHKKIFLFLQNKNNKNTNNNINKFDLYKFLDFVFFRNFKPFCFVKLNITQNNTLHNSKLLIEDSSFKEQNKENSNAMKMKKILPTVIKYIEIIDPKVKNRLFDLTKIDPFYSLGWILTWFTHNNENIFKNLRIIDYLLFSQINTIFYLVAVVKNNNIKLKLLF